MYLPLKRETGREHKREEGGVARRSQARTDCVCVHAESSCWALSRSALALSFPFSFPLTLSPRRHTDLSSWCKWSVNKTLRHWWYRAAPRWVKVCECADYTLLLPADLKNTFFQAERPKTWMKNSSSIKKSCCRTTQRWPWALVTHHKRTINTGNETNPEYMHMIHHLCPQFSFYPWQKNSLSARLSKGLKEENVQGILIL